MTPTYPKLSEISLFSNIFLAFVPLSIISFDLIKIRLPILVSTPRLLIPVGSIYLAIISASDVERS